MKTRVALLAAVLLVSTASAEETKTLTIGDKAPPIDVSHWLKSPVVPDSRPKEYVQFSNFENGKVTVLEFWATWCGPCKAGMPHLGDLQEKHAGDGVTILGISDEPLQTVATFLAQKATGGDLWYNTIRYSLATDPDESVKSDYFRAAGQRGIPCAFIVGKDGHVEWIGHPARMDKALQAVVDDKWDRTAFKAEWEGDQAAARVERAMGARLRAAVGAEDWKGALAIVDEALVAMPDNVGLLRQRFDFMLFADHAKDAYALGGQLVEEHWESAAQLNSLAWMVVDDKRIKTRDLDLAMKAAVRANELTDSKDAAILDTLARVFYEQGKLEKAIEWQSLAVEHAQPGQMADSIRQMLKKYQSEAAKKPEGEKGKQKKGEGAPNDFF